MTRTMMLALLLTAAIPPMGHAQTAEELKQDASTPGDVLTYGMGYAQHRYSPLAQINRQNVKRLVPAWAYSMSDNRISAGDNARRLLRHRQIEAAPCSMGNSIAPRSMRM
jgi:glucose dehydrogenase